MSNKLFVHLSLYINMACSLVIMEYVAFGFGDGIYIMALHTLLHCMAFGVISQTYGCDHTGTTSFIGHNVAASYLVGYEGRSSYASMFIHHWFDIEMQLHSLMGMKA